MQPKINAVDLPPLKKTTFGARLLWSAQQRESRDTAMQSEVAPNRWTECGLQ